MTNYRFYPLNEFTKLKGFNYIKSSSLLEIFKELDEVITNNNFELTKNDLDQIHNFLMYKFNIVCFNDDKLCCMMAVYVVDTLYKIIISDKSTEDNKIFKFILRSDADMYAKVTHKDERFELLYEGEDDFSKKLKEIFVNDMKQFYNENYKKISKHFGINRQTVENYGYEQWNDLCIEIKNYNNKLKQQGLPRIIFDNSDDAENTKESHRPSGTNSIEQICQIDKKTNEIIKVYPSIKDILENNKDYDKSGISQVLNGKRKTYKGYIWKIQKDDIIK